MNLRCVMRTLFTLIGILVCGMTLSQAEVIELEGTVKAVDAGARTISIERKTAKGTRTLDLEVAKKAGDLGAVKVGDPITFSYDPGLELVTKLISPESESAEAEVVVLKELGTAGHPWFSRDGLTIYFSSRESPQDPTFIWVAKRTSAEALFKDKKKLSLGLDCTFSDDGLEGIVFLPEEGKGTLQSLKRKSATDDFGRPTLIKELGTKELGDKNNFIVSPGLSADGLTLYCEVLGKGTCACTRSKPTNPWSKPKKLPIVTSEDGNQRFPYVADDGLWLFCTNTEIADPQTANIALYVRENDDDPFSFKGYLKAGETPLHGEFPRYVSATKELFFVKKKDGRPEIHVVKNFDPIKAVVE